jgi:hypothetical protein
VRRAIAISTGTYEGQRVWVVTGGLPSSDTVLVDPATLRPLRYVRPMLHSRLVQQYTHDSVAELLHVARPKERERMLRGELSLPDSGVGPLLVSWSPHSLEVLVQALPLTRAWRGGVYTVGWISLADRVPAFASLDLRAIGEERVTVPAGTFDCWRLEVREGDVRSLLWVSRDQGWMVMRQHTSRDGTGKWRTEWLHETRLVAVDTTPTPPAP